jgi:hypothetical protein
MFQDLNQEQVLELIEKKLSPVDDKALMFIYNVLGDEEFDRTSQMLEAIESLLIQRGRLVDPTNHISQHRGW